MKSLNIHLKHFDTHVRTHIINYRKIVLPMSKMGKLDLPKYTFTFCGFQTTYAYSHLNRRLYYCTRFEIDDFEMCTMSDNEGNQSLVTYDPKDWLKIDRKIQNLVIIGNSVEVGI